MTNSKKSQKSPKKKDNTARYIIIAAMIGATAVIIAAIIPVLLKKCSEPGPVGGGVELICNDYILKKENGNLVQIEPQMVPIPAGYFLMGSNRTEIELSIKSIPGWELNWFENEMPQRRIYLNSFCISKYEITNAQYKLFLDDKPGYEKPEYWYDKNFNGLDQPVVGVTWYDAIAYCNWLSDRTKKRYRLPTEAEWEKAARGTDGRMFPWGNTIPDTNKANFMEQHHGPVSISEKAGGISVFGLMHMAGNVSEWCSNWYDENYYNNFGNTDNPGESLSGTRKVVRGGSWKDNAFFLRCAARISYPPDTKKESLGFRVVRIPGN